MGILLGNFGVDQIAKRLKVEFGKEVYDLMEPIRQHEAANIASDKWHCFDMPFVIVCGSMETAQKINSILSPYSSKMTGQLRISVSNKGA